MSFLGDARPQHCRLPGPLGQGLREAKGWCLGSQAPLQWTDERCPFVARDGAGQGATVLGPLSPQRHPPHTHTHSFARGHTHFSGEKGTTSREAWRHKPFPSGHRDLPEITEAPPSPPSTSALSAAPPLQPPPQASPTSHLLRGRPAGTGPGLHFPSVRELPTPGHCNLWGETLSGHRSPAP